LQNKPNYPRFSPENNDFTKKQTQFKPNQSQFWAKNQGGKPKQTQFEPNQSYGNTKKSSIIDNCLLINEQK